jgi:hypothetical protein
LLSKHQQVQLMEAAAILLGMDETREGDKDPIVSMFTKQRGALANSVGSYASSPAAASSSASPSTSTKSLSTSPPPQSGRLTPVMVTEVHHNDIQMLNAFRNSARHSTERDTTTTTTSMVKVKVESVSTIRSDGLADSSLSNAQQQPSTVTASLTLDDEFFPDAARGDGFKRPPSSSPSISIASVPVPTGATTVVRVTENVLADVVMEREYKMEMDQKQQVHLIKHTPSSSLKQQQQQSYEPSFHGSDLEHRAPRHSGPPLPPLQYPSRQHPL